MPKRDARRREQTQTSSPDSSRKSRSRTSVQAEKTSLASATTTTGSPSLPSTVHRSPLHPPLHPPEAETHERLDLARNSPTQAASPRRFRCELLGYKAPSLRNRADRNEGCRRRPKNIVARENERDAVFAPITWQRYPGEATTIVVVPPLLKNSDMPHVIAFDAAASTMHNDRPESEARRADVQTKQQDPP